MHRFVTGLGFCLLLFTSACDDLPEGLRSKISINILTPFDESELSSTAPVQLKANIRSENKLKQYSIQILSAADNSELLKSTEVVGSTFVELDETIDFFFEAQRTLIIKIQATDINSEVAERTITVTKKAIPGFDERLGLGVSMVHYEEIPVNNIVKMESKFILTNYGKKTYNKGETLFINSKFNDLYFDLRLIPGHTTPLKLHKDLNKGDTLHFNPGYVDAKAMLATNLPGIYQAPELKLCIVVWGTTESSVQHNKPGATLCTTCGTYRP